MAYTDLGPTGHPYAVTKTGVKGMGPGRALVIVDAEERFDKKNNKPYYRVRMRARNDVYDLNRKNGETSFQADPNPQLISKPYGSLAYNKDGSVKTYTKNFTDETGAVHTQELPVFREFDDYIIKSEDQLNFYNQYMQDGKSIQDFAKKCDEYKKNHNGRSAYVNGDADFLKDNALVFNAPLVVQYNETVLDRARNNITISKVGDIDVTDQRNLPKEDASGKKLGPNQTITFKYKTSKTSSVPDSKEVTMDIRDYNKPIGLVPQIPTVKAMRAKAASDKKMPIRDDYKKDFDRFKGVFDNWAKASDATSTYDYNKDQAATAYANYAWIHYPPNKDGSRAVRRFEPGEPAYMDFKTFEEKVWPQMKEHMNKPEQENPLKKARLDFQEAYEKANGTRAGMPWIAIIDRDNKANEMYKQAMWIVCQQIGFDDYSLIKQRDAIDYTNVDVDKLGRMMDEPAAEEPAPAEDSAQAEEPKSVDELKQQLQSAQSGVLPEQQEAQEQADSPEEGFEVADESLPF